MSAFQDQVVVVTGASKGIGAAIAKHFGKAGAKVVVNYASDAAGAEKVVADITSGGGTAVAVQGSVAKEEDVKRLFAEVRERFGKIDVLVNNAGVYKFGALADVTGDDFEWMFGVNVRGLLLASREALPLFGESGGSIINIGSTVSTFAPPETSIYAATKGAVDTITIVLSKELGPRKIRVNSINPGMVDTEGARTAGATTEDSEFRKQLEAMSPLGRIGTPDDIASAVLHLASSDSSWVTGERWAVSGGVR